MKKIHEFLSRPVVTVLLFALAIGLLGGSAMGGTRAALNDESRVYDSKVTMPTIGVVLLENGNPVSGSDEMLSSVGKLLPGKKYEEKLTVANNGSIDEFVRVTVQWYWLDKNGDKAPKMDPNWIVPKYVTGGWQEDTSSKTDERRVFYYSTALAPGDETEPFLESFTVKGEIAQKVTQTRNPETGDSYTITTKYDYDGCQLCLKASVDSVQTHNGQDAVKSAWGKSVTVSGNSLSLS